MTDSWKLTEKGEKIAVEQLGGQDIVNVAAFMSELLRFQYPDRKGSFSFMEWEICCLTIRVLREVVRRKMTWGEAAKEIEDQLAELKPEYFEKMPHAG